MLIIDLDVDVSIFQLIILVLKSKNLMGSFVCNFDIL